MTRLFDLLLYLYPKSFRGEYGREMRAVFAAKLRDASSTIGRLAVLVSACFDVPIDALGAHWDILRQDLRFTRASLRRAPGFAFTAVLIVALGVGANTAVFSVTDFALLRPLPFPEPHELVKLWHSPNGSGRSEVSPVSYRDWKAMSKSFDAMGAYATFSDNMVGRGEPERIVGLRVTPDLLPLLGVQPLAGRFPEDEGSALISYGFWQSHYGNDLGAVGQRILLDGTPHVISGIMPRGFYFPDRERSMWTPLRLGETDFANRGNNYLYVVGRLREGVASADAQSELRGVAETLRNQYPRELGKAGIALIGVHEDGVSSSARMLLVTLCGAAACILLLACANLANLLLVRAIGRQRELALRTALGAGRERLVRQMITESVVLAAAGGALGVLVAYAAVPMLAQLVPSALPMDGTPSVNARALIFAGVLTAATGVLFGLIPAFRAGGKGTFAGLREGSRAGSGKTFLRSSLVVVEVAASVVLLVSSGLLVRAMWKLQSTDLGFHSENILTLRTTLAQPKYRTVASREQFYSRVIDEIQAIPGVERAAYITFLPMVTTGGVTSVTMTGREPVSDGSTNVSLRYTTPGFFAALDIPINAGRDVETADTRDRESVAVVSQSFARKFWPGEDALGKRFTVGSTERTIVGIVGDVRVRGPEVPSEPQLYVPHGQVADGGGLFFVPKDLVVETTLTASALLPAVQRIVRGADPDQPISNVRMMSDIVDGQTASRAVQVRVLAVLALLAFVVAGVGIHGVIAFTVSQQKREIGVRLALGAQPRDILLMVLRRGLALAAFGIVPGVALAYAAGRFMQTLLAGVSPADAPTFGAAVGLCFAMALLGCLLPALRAMRVDPLTVIRAE